MLDNYQDLIDELLGTPKLVREAIANASALPLINAMRARDRAVLDRVQRIKNQTDPHLKTLSDEVDHLTGGQLETDQSVLLDSFETSRGDLVSLLMNLTLRDWERTATVESGGIITLADEVETHVEFDEAMRARLESLG